MPPSRYEDDIYCIMTLYYPGITFEHTIESLLFTKKRIIKNKTLYYTNCARYFDLIKQIDKYINDIKQKIENEKSVNLNKKQEIPTLENCAICMEKFNIDDVIATPCKQCKIRAFHIECHAQAAEYSPLCPLCRYKN
jgi:hypothetical protein